MLDASYVGVSTQYLIETADGRRLTVYAQNLETSGAGEVLADGQRVRLNMEPTAPFVISRDGTPSSPGEPDEEEPQTMRDDTPIERAIARAFAGNRISRRRFMRQTGAAW